MCGFCGIESCHWVFQAHDQADSDNESINRPASSCGSTKTESVNSSSSSVNRKLKRRYSEASFTGLNNIRTEYITVCAYRLLTSYQTLSQFPCSENPPWILWNRRSTQQVTANTWSGCCRRWCWPTFKRLQWTTVAMSVRLWQVPISGRLRKCGKCMIW